MPAVFLDFFPDFKEYIYVAGIQDYDGKFRVALNVGTDRNVNDIVVCDGSGD